MLFLIENQTLVSDCALRERSLVRIVSLSDMLINLSLLVFNIVELIKLSIKKMSVVRIAIALSGTSINSYHIILCH